MASIHNEHRITASKSCTTLYINTIMKIVSTLLLLAALLSFAFQSDAQSVCARVAATDEACMNEENLQACQDLEASGCTNILFLESCPLQFGCDDDAASSEGGDPNETVTSDPTSCEVGDMRGNVVTVADGDTFTTAAFCRHNYEATDGEQPSEIVTTTVLCTNGVTEDVSEDVQSCPEDEPECYDLDQYSEEEWEPSCMSTSDATTSAGAGNTVHLAFVMGVPAIIVATSHIFHSYE